MKKSRYKKSTKTADVFRTLWKITVLTIIVVYCVSIMIAPIWGLMTSFKPFDEYYLSAWKLPKKWVFSNYTYILKNISIDVNTPAGRVTYGLGDMLLTSLVWATGCALVGSFNITAQAYVFTKYKFVGRNALMAIGMFLMITPLFFSGGQSLLIMKRIRVYDNMLLVVLWGFVGGFYGMQFLIMCGGFKAIPWDFSEAAFLDGAGHFRVFFRIMLPMIMPTTMVFVILGFISQWNDYGTFLTILPSYANLAFGMYYFQFEAALNGATVPQILAGFILVLIPSITMYIIAQKTVMKNYVVGGLKA